MASTPDASTYVMSKATRTTLRESVVDNLRAAILSGEIPAGAHLGEIGLSANLGISRGTLREGLRQLQQEGLAIQDSRGRMFVRRASAQEVRDLYEVRLGLESIAVRRLCNAEDRDAIVQELTERLQRFRDPTSLNSGLDADLNFHGALCRRSGNELLLKSWEDISGLVRITMLTAGPDLARQNMSYDRHAPIVELVNNGDADAACEFLKQHMDSAAASLVERLEAGAQ